ncbi:MAG: hypothetical protein LAP85_19790 [Acidobacteriia bacterium]|nr:hypothetical protein [Terriglobia bacterium]
MKYIKDLLLTDTFLIKGHLNTGGQRLSTYLNSTPRSFLEVEKAILVNHVQREDAETARILVRVDEIMLAHEMETTGDESLRLLAEPEKDLLAIAAHTGGMTPLKLSGKVSRRAIERDTPTCHDFVIVIEPKLRGLTDKAAQICAVFDGLPFVIANRNRLAIIFR